jgi:cytochrome c5
MRLKVCIFLITAGAIGYLVAAESTSSSPAKASATQAPVAKAASAKPVAAPLAKSAAPSQAAFDKAVKPIFESTCSMCHTGSSASGGLSVDQYSTVDSINSGREEWEKIVHRMEANEMPPAALPRTDEMKAQIADAVKFVREEFKREDALVKPDPGRVTARRLNRSEYTNTIRDLLAVDFRADRNFPTDDSGEGFDNIGDILTVSPLLMDKYISAARTIAARAIGADPLPKKPIEIEYSTRLKNIRRLDYSTVEATHRVDFDAEYDIRIGLPGQRAADAKPVELVLWMDGKRLESVIAETKPSTLTYFNPYSEEHMHVYLPEGDHVFRLGFVNDEFVKTITDDKTAYDDKKNKFINSMFFVGPYPSKVEKESRKKILTCDPATGPVCVDKIISTLARRAYRRPVTKTEVAALTHFVTLAKAEGRTPEQGIQLAIQAMLVSPHFLFHIEHDANPTDPNAIHHISDIEMANRMSYFLWSSMPDEELQTLGETGKLSQPAVLDAQIKRMLADPKSSAMAENFAGQWLEIRNLDNIKPDPEKFPAWGPELRDAFKTETRMFFDNMLRENRPIGEFLNARYTYLNEFLAKYYGITDVKGPDFRRVDLKTEERGGILSQGSVLAVSSYPSRTSVVIRGKYILQNILGTPPPPPPPDVPPLDEGSVGTAMSLRQQMEKHRANAVCASCHSRMDPLGFGLENYDAVGKWRIMDGKFPVDSSGILPSGKSFSTPLQMREVLTSLQADFARCLTEKMLVYALGRGLKPYDRRTVEDIDTKLAASGYGFQTLVSEVVHSLPFQERRGEEVTSENAVKPKQIAAK